MLSIIGITHPAVEDYLRRINPNEWVMLPVDNQVKLYGWRSPNFVESENGAAVPARFLFPFDMFTHYMEKFIQQAFETRKLAANLKSKGETISLYAAKLPAEEQSDSGHYFALQATI
ncbi:TPA: hypothetical protein N0F65_006166 [Lagenidium giganteum]|uniref:Uncharacterized protein n=1 Tax=Lagenidium giganteum TaxID=4803 RepID=A0AAV2Z4I9_9STRA|nr:TPA: hypothetical protein N0F65_006166 [Lagenidium giganteum]